MAILYMTLICLSAGLASYVAVRGLRRLAPLIHRLPAVGWCAVLPAIGFLMVVGAPAPVLVSALLTGAALQFFPGRFESPLWLCALLVLAVLIGLSGLSAPTEPRLAAVPVLAVAAVSGGVWMLLLFGMSTMPEGTGNVALGALPSLLAVAAAPLVAADAAGVTYDAAIILSALGGALLGGGYKLAFGLAPRMALGVVLGYLPIWALWHGAWMAAAASLILSCGALAWSWVKNDPWGERHA